MHEEIIVINNETCLIPVLQWSNSNTLTYWVSAHAILKLSKKAF